MCGADDRPGREWNWALRESYTGAVSASETPPLLINSLIILILVAKVDFLMRTQCTLRFVSSLDRVCFAHGEKKER